MGSNSLQTEGSYSEQYALFSGQYAHGNIEDIIESVYEKEMLEMSQKNTHMGTVANLGINKCHQQANNEHFSR